MALTVTDNDILKRVVRYSELKPQKQSFIDTRNAGSEEKESFSVIGGGVVENKSRHVHIDIPHGFNMGGARMPPGVVNGQHSHETPEVFLVHRGTFKFVLGPDRDDGDLELTVGDVISIPTQVFRGFCNSGDNIGHLVSVIGGNDPGRVTWAPYIFREAEKNGLVLLENGSLIDTAAGESIPEGAKPVKPTTYSDVERFVRLTPADMLGWYAKADALEPATDSPLSRPGVSECPVIGVANPAENMPAGPIPASHGFQMRRVRMQPDATIPPHSRAEEEVLFVQAGSVEVSIHGNNVTLNKGDYFTLPIGEVRSWVNAGTASNDVQVIRGGDHPAAPDWR